MKGRDDLHILTGLEDRRGAAVGCMEGGGEQKHT